MVVLRLYLTLQNFFWTVVIFCKGNYSKEEGDDLCAHVFECGELLGHVLSFFDEAEGVSVRTVSRAFMENIPRYIHAEGVLCWIEDCVDVLVWNVVVWQLCAVYRWVERVSVRAREMVSVVCVCE